MHLCPLRNQLCTVSCGGSRAWSSDDNKSGVKVEVSLLRLTVCTMGFKGVLSYYSFLKRKRKLPIQLKQLEVSGKPRSSALLWLILNLTS